MKKIIALLLVLALVCSGAVSCGAKEKAQEKAAEKLTEKMLEQGGAEDVDIDGDKVTFKTEEGGEVSFGGGEWPKSDLAKSIPEFKDGKLSSTMETSNYMTVSFEEVKADDAVAYIEKVKADFPLDNYESKSEGMITWSGKDDTNLQLNLTLSDATFVIMMYLEEKTE